MEQRVRVRDIELHYYDTNPQDGEGPVVVLVHGLGGCFEAWEFQIPFLERAGYRVIAVDQRGHGRSSKPHEPYTIEQMSADMAALLEHLGLTGIGLVGHSLGGMVSTHLAATRPDLVDRVMIINSFSKIPSIRPKGIAKLLFRTSVIYGLGLRAWGRWLSWELLPGLQQGALRARLMELADFNDDRTAYVNAMLAAVRADLRPLLPRLQCPVRILSADQDYTPLADKQADAARINKGRFGTALPLARAVEIPHSRHLSPWDQPQRINSEILSFLRFER